jgi:tetratricopeptide (TPR) repeat protein
LIFHGLLKIEDTKVSLRDWDRLVKISPANVPFRFMRGMLLTKADSFDLAFSDLRKVVDAAQLNSNKFEGQQSGLDKRIDIEYAGFYVVSNVYGFPDADALRLKKAYCLLFPGRYDEALKSISQIKGSSSSPLCLFLKGLVYEHKGAHQLAYHAYDSALRFDDEIIDAYKKRGIYRMELKQWNFAEFDFRQMLKINPEAYVAYRLRGLSRLNNYKYDGAIEDYTAYLEKDSTNRVVRAERGMAYQKLHLYLPSTVDLMKSENFQAIEPFQVLEFQLNQLLEAKDTTKVMWWLNQFNKYGPGYFPSRKMTLKLLVDQKRWMDVSRCADEALNQKNSLGRRPYDPIDESFLLTMKSISLLQQQNEVDAIRNLNAAIDLDKKNAKAYVTRADANMRLKNKEGARADLEIAVKLGDKIAADKLKSIQ